MLLNLAAVILHRSLFSVKVIVFMHELITVISCVACVLAFVALRLFDILVFVSKLADLSNNG